MEKTSKIHQQGIKGENPHPLPSLTSNTDFKELQIIIKADHIINRFLWEYNKIRCTSQINRNCNPKDKRQPRTGKICQLCTRKHYQGNDKKYCHSVCVADLQDCHLSKINYHDQRPVITYLGRIITDSLIECHGKCEKKITRPVYWARGKNCPYCKYDEDKLHGLTNKKNAKINHQAYEDTKITRERLLYGEELVNPDIDTMKAPEEIPEPEDPADAESLLNVWQPENLEAPIQNVVNNSGRFIRRRDSGKFKEVAKYLYLENTKGIAKGWDIERVNGGFTYYINKLNPNGSGKWFKSLSQFIFPELPEITIYKATYLGFPISQFKLNKIPLKFYDLPLIIQLMVQQAKQEIVIPYHPKKESEKNIPFKKKRVYIKIHKNEIIIKSTRPLKSWRNTGNPPPGLNYTARGPIKKWKVKKEFKGSKTFWISDHNFKITHWETFQQFQDLTAANITPSKRTAKKRELKYYKIIDPVGDEKVEIISRILPSDGHLNDDNSHESELYQVLYYYLGRNYLKNIYADKPTRPAKLQGKKLSYYPDGNIKKIEGLTERKPFIISYSDDQAVYENTPEGLSIEPKEYKHLGNIRVWQDYQSSNHYILNNSERLPWRATSEIRPSKSKGIKPVTSKPLEKCPDCGSTDIGQTPNLNTKTDNKYGFYEDSYISLERPGEKICKSCGLVIDQDIEWNLDNPPEHIETTHNFVANRLENLIPPLYYKREKA